MRFVAIVGDPKPQSWTLAVSRQAAAAIGEAAGLAEECRVIDLSGLARRLLLPDPSAAVEDALEQVAGADLLLVGSPTCKGTYAGLLKVFLDRLPHRALAGAVAFPLLVMGAGQHALAVEVYLRPLLVELGATVPTPGLAVLEQDLGDLDHLLRHWAALVAGDLRRPAAALSPGRP